MNVSSGATAAMLKTGEPHAVQKCRCVSPPWSSPIVTNEAIVFPSALKASRGDADDHREWVARLALAVGAVADGLNHRLGIGAVGHGAAQTATGDWLGCAAHVGLTLYEN